MRRDFVANVSHELKTPLAAIKGFVETLRDDPKMQVSRRQRFLERISTQSDRLNSLVGDLLTLSRLDETAGGTEGFQPCDVALVVRETVRDLTSLAERKGLELSANVPDRPQFVRAEREGLRQVVSNLVDNAIKYTPEGGVVAVSLSTTGEDGPARGRGHRDRALSRGPEPRVRAVLPRRSRALPRARRHRPRALDREEHRSRHRR